MHNLNIEENVSQKIIKSCWIIFAFSTVTSLMIFLSPYTTGKINQFYGLTVCQLFAFSLMTLLHKYNKSKKNLKYYVNVIFVIMIAVITIILKNPEIFSIFYLIMAINISYGDRRLHYLSSFFQISIYLLTAFFVPMILPMPSIEDTTVSLLATRMIIFCIVVFVVDLLNTYTLKLNEQIHLKEKQIIETAVTESASALIQALEAKDPCTNGHSLRTSKYAQLIAGKLSSEMRISKDLFLTGSILHDIGKISIPDSILNKKGILSKPEFDKIKEHSSKGAMILEKSESLRSIIPMVMYHHERFDGKGYPYGLKGEEIPLEARILSVADAYDAMTSKRPYRDALTTDYAIKEILNYKGTQFCPRVVDVFVKIYPEIVNMNQGLHEQFNEKSEEGFRGLI